MPKSDPVSKDNLWQKVIATRLQQGRIDLAWHNFMNAVLSTSFPCSMEVLRVLLYAIDEAAMTAHHWNPLKEDTTGVMHEDELTFETSNKLENMLSRFVTQLPGEAYILDTDCLRILRIYKHYREPKPRVSQAFNETKFPGFTTNTSSAPV